MDIRYESYVILYLVKHKNTSADILGISFFFTYFTVTSKISNATNVFKKEHFQFLKSRRVKREISIIRRIYYKRSYYLILTVV